jgi:NAD(P)-dependent dehydrogenase (short-subunit alcohol dehydrogenase family)
MTCSRRHVLVTGASTGIGRATALHLASTGWHVFATVRKRADADELAGLAHHSGSVTPLLMDVTDPSQIQAAAHTVESHVGSTGLTALVANAGIGVAWPMELVPLDALRHQFEVNVIGQVGVTQEFMPMLRRAQGTVVIIGSIGDRFTPPFGGPLAASKCAIASIADALRQELAPWGIRVVLVEPASIHTDAIDKLIRDTSSTADQFDRHGRALYGDSFRNMVEVATKRERNGSPPDVVARKIATILSKRRPRARYLVGKDAQVMANLVRLLPISLLDALRRRLFGLPAPGSRALTQSSRGVLDEVG